MGSEPLSVYSLCRHLVIMGLGRVNWFLSLAVFFFSCKTSAFQELLHSLGRSLGFLGPCRSQVSKAGHLNRSLGPGRGGPLEGSLGRPIPYPLLPQAPGIHLGPEQGPSFT